MTLDVAFVTDRAYLPWCATAALSCADKNLGLGLHIHLLHDGSLTAGDVEQLHRMLPDGILSTYAVEAERFAHLPAVDRFGHIVWLRFLLPELLPHVERVLYLDADTFVANDLGPLVELDIGDAPIAAVPNVMLPEDLERVAQAAALDPFDYFNSGVLWMDLTRLRAESLAERVAEGVAAFSCHLRWPDQDVLNFLFAGRWHRLHPRYNTMNLVYDCQGASEQVYGTTASEAIRDPAILHFAGDYLMKPWHTLSRHPWRDQYRATLARTPWSAVGWDDDVPSTRAIRRLPGPLQLPIYEQVVRRRQGKRPSVRSMVRGMRYRRRMAQARPTSGANYG